MAENDWLIEPADRVALLRHGIVVLDADPEQRRLAVTGWDEDRAIEVVRARLGDAVAVEVVDDLPRKLWPRRCVGYMEREAGRLQLRFCLHADEHVEDIVVAEDLQTVVVYGTVCAPVFGELGPVCECPCHVYLERPLGGRAVIDGVTGYVVPYKNVYAKYSARG